MPKLEGSREAQLGLLRADGAWAEPQRKGHAEEEAGTHPLRVGKCLVAPHRLLWATRGGERVAPPGYSPPGSAGTLDALRGRLEVIHFGETWAQGQRGTLQHGGAHGTPQRARGVTTCGHRLQGLCWLLQSSPGCTARAPRGTAVAVGRCCSGRSPRLEGAPRPHGNGRRRAREDQSPFIIFPRLAFLLLSLG